MPFINRAKLEKAFRDANDHVIERMTNLFKNFNDSYAERLRYTDKTIAEIGKDINAINKNMNNTHTKSSSLLENLSETDIKIKELTNAVSQAKVSIDNIYKNEIIKLNDEIIELNKTITVLKTSKDKTEITKLNTEIDVLKHELEIKDKLIANIMANSNTKAIIDEINRVDMGDISSLTELIRAANSPSTVKY